MPPFLAAPTRATRRFFDQRDPLRATVVIAALFFLLGLCRLGIPSRLMFDEIHYIPAARRLIDLTRRLNPEHPLLGKEAIAIGIRLFGDHSFGWRFPNLVLGTIGLFAATRALWWASRSRRVSLLFGFFLATDFIWFVLSRIGMLDMAMCATMALGMWQWALSARGQWADRRGGRVHLVLAGMFFGLSLGGKWNGAPLLVVPGVLFAWQRAVALDLVHWRRRDWRKMIAGLRQWLFATRAGPVRGVSLAEAALWLGLWPLIVYMATFAPAFFYKVQPMTFAGLIPWQSYMLKLQDSVIKPHRYMSRWWQWIFNLRPIWFLYGRNDGAQRGILMLGNPFSMLAALPALAWCGWKAWRERLVGSGALPGLLILLYVLSLIFWAINGKPVQFYYHYELAGSFLMAAFALMLGTWWDAGLRWPGRTAVVLAAVVFIGFYPIISAGPLPGKKSYVDYMWLKSWR